MIGNLIAYLVVAIAALYAGWRFLPRALKRKAAAFFVDRLGLSGSKARRFTSKLESSGACGNCDSCKACATPAEHDGQPLSFKKQKM